MNTKVSISGGPGDGLLYKDAATWNDIASANVNVVSSIANLGLIKSYIHGTPYRLTRSGYVFDLSSIPADSVLIWATIYIYASVNVQGSNAHKLYAYNWGPILEGSDWGNLTVPIATKASGEFSPGIYNSYPITNLVAVTLGQPFYVMAAFDDEITLNSGIAMAGSYYYEQGLDFVPKMELEYYSPSNHGVTTYDGADSVVTFTESGTFITPDSVPTGEVLVVAGGGAGAFNLSGGGGAGAGYISGSFKKGGSGFVVVRYITPLFEENKFIPQIIMVM